MSLHLPALYSVLRVVLMRTDTNTYELTDRTEEIVRREQNRQLLLGRIRAARGRDDEQRLLEDQEKANQRRVPVCRFRIPDTSQASYPQGQQAHPTFPNMSLQDPIETPTHEHWIDSEEDEYPIFGRPVSPNDEAVVCTTAESQDRNPENQAAEELEASHAIYEDIFRTTSETMCFEIALNQQIVSELQKKKVGS
ncbi:unnamed protein product [Caenorhabditis nigoni]